MDSQGGVKARGRLDSRPEHPSNSCPVGTLPAKQARRFLLQGTQGRLGSLGNRARGGEPMGGDQADCCPPDATVWIRGGTPEEAAFAAVNGLVASPGGAIRPNI